MRGLSEALDVLHDLRTPVYGKGGQPLDRSKLA